MIAKLSESELIAQKECRTNLFIAQQECCISYSNVRRSITNGLPPFDQKPMM